MNHRVALRGGRATGAILLVRDEDPPFVELSTMLAGPRQQYTRFRRTEEFDADGNRIYEFEREEWRDGEPEQEDEVNR